MSYIPFLDGLRFLAIALVVLNHLDISGFGGGYVGVDIFFVLSGYLITTILVKEYSENYRRKSTVASGYVNVKAFYFKRARRILPVALVVITFSLIGAYFEFTSARFLEESLNSIWSIFFLANYHLIEGATNYFATDFANKSIFQHYWSLAVEEQFYLVYPLIFLLTSKLHGLRSGKIALTWNRRLTIALGLIWVLSFTYNLIGISSSPVRMYFSTFSRVWEISSGCLLAMMIYSRIPFPKRKKMQQLSLVGLTAIVFSCVRYSNESPYPGLLALIPVIGTVLLIYSSIPVQQDPLLIVRLLSFRPVRFLGKISYSAYLIHWPLNIFVKLNYSDLLKNEIGKISFLIVLLVLSTISYLLIEKPTRKIPVPRKYLEIKTSWTNIVWKVLGRIDGDIWFISIAFGLLIFIGGFIHNYHPPLESKVSFQPYVFEQSDTKISNNLSDSSNGPGNEDATASSQSDSNIYSPKNIYTPAFQTSISLWRQGLTPKEVQKTFDSGTLPTLAQVNSNTVPWGTNPIWNTCQNTNSIDGRADFFCDYKNGVEGEEVNVFLVGDSHAQQIIPMVVNSFSGKNLHLIVFGRTGCFIGGIIHSNSPQSDRSCLALWQSKIQVKFASSKFDYAIASDLGQTDNTASKVSSLKFLKSITSRLILVAPTPGYPASKICLNQSSDISKCSGAPSAAVNSYVNLGKILNMQFFPISEFLCIQNSCPVIIRDTFVHIGDGGHLSGAITKELSGPFSIFLNIS